MSIYLVDYENVSLAGLEGIEKLSDSEKVYIFYGNSAGSISFEMHAKIAQTRAQVRYLKTERSGKNYLDFQLATLGGYLVAMTKETEFIIVSRDTGFESVVDFWNQPSCATRPGCHFKRQERISGSCSSEENTKERAAKKKAVKESEKRTQEEKAPEKQKNKQKAELQKPKTKAKENAKQKKKPEVKEQKTEKVQSKLEERYKKEIRELVREECHSPQDYSMIYKIIIRTEREEVFCAQMLEGFQKERGTKLCELVLPVYQKILRERKSEGKDSSAK